MNEFDRAARFSDPTILDLMVGFASRVGMQHSISDDGWFRYNDSDALCHDSPDIVALDESFGPDWLALVMDTDVQLQKFTAELAQSGKRYVIEWTDTQTMVIVDFRDCPAAWINHQV